MCEFSLVGNVDAASSPNLSDRKRRNAFSDIVLNSADEEELRLYFEESQKPAAKDFYIVWLSARNRYQDVVEVYHRSLSILNHSYNVARLTELKTIVQLTEKFIALSGSASSSPDPVPLTKSLV